MKISFIDYCERAFVRSLLALPSKLVLQLLLQRTVQVNDHILDPEIQLYLLLRKLGRKPLMCTLPPVQSRRAFVKDSLVHGIRLPEIHTKDFFIPSGEHQIAARLFIKSDVDATIPTIIYFHGGGFVIGDIEMFDHVCRFMASETGFNVLSVDYRKAPEHPFPAGINDAVAAFDWVVSHASELGADPSKLILAGDSAGANIATVLSQILSTKETIRPCHQLLFYPVCDVSKEYPSYHLFGDGFFLTKLDFEYFNAHYLGKDSSYDLSHPWLSPILGEHLSKVPPTTILTAEFDPLRDGGEAYALELQKAGVSTELIRVKGNIHAFINLVGISKSSRESFRDALHRLRSKIL